MRSKIWAVVVVTVAAAAWSSSVAGAGPVAHASARKCGSLYDAYYRYKVSATRVSCSFALRIVRSYRLSGRKGWHMHGNGILANTYYTSSKYPGWRCGDGSGGGGCARGSKSAGWEIPPPG